MFAEKKHRQQEAVVGIAITMGVVFFVGLLLNSLCISVFLAFLCSFPIWLPYLVVRIRFLLFQKINEGSKQIAIQIPNAEYNAEIFDFLYNHKNAQIRSHQKEVGLADFLWYLHSPTHGIHQEQMETDTENYQILSKVTKAIINHPKAVLVELCNKYIIKLDLFGKLMVDSHKWFGTGNLKILHLRQFFSPLFIYLMLELIFNPHLSSSNNESFEVCTDDELQVIFEGVENFIIGVKFLCVRNMEKRYALTEYLLRRIKNGDADHHFNHIQGDILSDAQKAFYLQGAFFQTGVVQMSEAMAHICMGFAQHCNTDADSNGSNGKYTFEELKNNSNLKNFLNETFRVYPLFGVSLRITSEDIQLPVECGSSSCRYTARVVPKGTCIDFNHPKFQRRGYKNGLEFRPRRWQFRNEKHSNFIPFGAKGNRPCPAKNIALIWCMFICQHMLGIGVRWFTPVLHTRSLPDGGLCMMMIGSSDTNKNHLILNLVMLGIWFWEQFITVYNSFLQLFCGIYTIWHSRKLRLAQKWCQEERKCEMKTVAN